MTAQVAQHSESRDRVLNAAYGLFLQNGLTAVSMQQIADESGITKATLYHHFRDKQDLYLATMQVAITNNERALAESLAGATDVQVIVRELLAYIFGDVRADLQRLATDFKQHVDQETQNQFWAQYQMPWHLVRSAVENADGFEGEDIQFVSRYIYGAAAGLSHLFRFEEDTFPVDDIVLDHLAECMLNGLITSPKKSQ